MKRIASQIMALGLSFLLCVSADAQQAVTQSIVTDGKTNTTVKTTGKTTTITTSTVQGSVGYNSFSTFNIAKGNTVDLILPAGTVNLLNLVNSQAINIFGILNSIQNGKVGGNVLFADPFGMVVGKGGSLNVGALMVITPTQAFMDSMFTAGAPSAANTTALMNGAVPISSDGLILVQGRVNTINDAVLVGQNITNSGKITSGAFFQSSQPDFSDVVNVNGLVAGTALSTSNGNIQITAQNDFQNSGEISTNGNTGLNAGNINVHAGHDVTLSAGSLISASGVGQNSNAGSIKIMAEHNGNFDQGAVIAAKGGNVSGNGGAIEFSAKDTVTLAGGSFEGSAAHGKAGSVLVDPTDTDVTANVTMDGTDYTNTGDTLEVEPGVTISTQSSTAGGASGNISITETQSINIKGGATLDASGNGGGTAGNVSLTVNSSVSKTWDPNSPDSAFNTDQANASITVGSGAVIKGQDITLAANATSSKTATIAPTSDGSRTEAPDPLCVVFGGGNTCGSGAASVVDKILNLIGVNKYVGGIVSSASANIQMGGNITATGTVKLDSEASSTANFTANGLYITYVQSDATAVAQVLNGANITTTGDVDVTAHSKNNLTNTGKALAGQSNNGNTVTQSGPAVVFVYSDGNSTSTAGLEQGSTVNAANVNLLAKNENSFQTQAQPSVNGDGSSDQQYGAGAALAISNTNSSTDSHINGTVTATAAVTSDAESLDNKNETDATAVVKNSNSDDKSSNTSSADSKVSGSSNALEIGAAVAIASDSNTASSTVGPNAVINATGNVTIEANASDKFKEDVSGSADTASTISAGGAVAIADYTNTATASIGQNASVTSGGTTDVKATAEMPNDLAADLVSVEQFLENFNLSGDVSNLKSFLGNSTSSVSGLQTAYNSIKTAYNNLKDGTTTSVSSTGQPGGGGVGVAGAVTVLSANNTATAFVDQGATVKSKAATVEASATTQSTNDAGTSTAQNSKDSTQNNTGSGSPLGSFGGTYAGITYNDTATAYIANGATVNTTGGDLNVTSTANNFMANMVAAGQDSGGTLGVSGATSDVTINSKSIASIGDQAQVNVIGNVKVDAENTTRAYQIADDTNAAQTVSIGVVVGSLNINDTTGAFIGDNGTATGFPTGQVTATGNVNVTANNSDRLMALAASSVKNSNGNTNTGGANGNGKTPSSGSSNGTNNTSDSNSQTNAGYNFGIGVSGDVAFNNITDVTKGYISDGVTVKSATTAVSAQDKTLVLAADGGLVRSSTAGLQGSLAKNSINKTTEAYTDGVTIDTGSLSVTSNSSDIVLALSAGGAGDSSNSSQVFSLAGSAVYNNISNDTTASVDNSTVAGTAGGVTPTGAVTISATNRDTGYSVAGSFDYSSGDVGVGVSLDLGIINNTVKAGIGNGSNILSNNNVQVTSSDDENQLAVSADLASSADFSVAASIAGQTLTKDVEAYIGNNATVKTTGGTISVNANDDHGGTSLGLPTGLIQIAGTFADGSDVGLGAAASVSTTSKTVSASIGNSSSVSASGDVDVAATTSDNLYLFAGGGGIGETAGFMGSAIFNNVNNNTSATIGSSTVVANNVNVNASDNLNVVDAAGGYAGSSSASVGAGGDIEAIGTLGNPQTVSAAINSGANVSATNNVNVTAKQNQTAVSVAADAGFGGDVTVIGSGTVLDYNTDTSASSSGNVTAGGTLDVSADRETNFTTVAGQAALGGTAGIGIAVSFIDKSDSVYAYVGGGTSNVGGLEVSATGNDSLLPVAAGGALSESVGIAGSAVVNILNETTDAYIGASNPAIIAAAGGVSVTSTSNTNLSPSIAGALALGIDTGAATAADVTTISKNTTAEVYSGANVSSTGNVLLGSNSEELADSLGLSAAGGVYAGVAVAASVYVINDTTNASIDGGATVYANDSVGVSANDQTVLDLLEGHISGGIAGVGAALALADVTKHTNAIVDGTVTARGHGSAINADNGNFGISYVSFGSGATSYGAQVPNSNGDFTSDPMFQGERRASPNTSAVNGLAVTATSENDFNTVAAGAAGGYVGVVANGSILLLNNNTKSEIGSGANIGAGTDSVMVAAGSDVGHIGSALGVAGGFVGAGAGFDVSIIGNNTTADITNASVNANGNVSVNANASEDVLSLVAGISGGFVGVTGSVSVSELKDTTKAYISGNSVNASGNLSVNSNDATDVDLLVGAVGGGAVGVGGSVAVDLVTKNTTAYIDNGTNTSAGGSTTVAANSSEKISDGTIAGGGGVYAGAAGAVSIESDNSSTTATMGTGTDTAGNGLTVSAQNTANATTFVGTIGGALFGGTAGSVDVGNIENPTSAEILGANASTTGGDVNVSATETRNINSYAVSAGLAIGTINASVIDWGVSAGVNTNGAALSSGKNPLDGSSYGGGAGTVYDGADSQSNSAASMGSGMLGEFGGGAAGQQALSASSDLSASTGGSSVSTAVTEAPTTKGTTAEIYGGSVQSAGAVNVTSNDTTKMNLTAGGASVSIVGVGASVTIASVNTSSNAEILGGSSVSANGGVTVSASRTDNMNGSAYDGQLGFAFAGGAAVTVLNDSGTTTAELNATVSQTSCLTVEAETIRNDNVTAGQLGGGAIAAGYSYASANEQGNTSALIDSGSATLLGVQAVLVSADDNSTATANSTAISVGIVGIGGAEADANVTPGVVAQIAGGTTIDTMAPTAANPAAGNVQVLASAEGVAYSNVTGTNAGGATIGVGSVANATSEPELYASIDGTVNAGANVTVAARYNYNSSDQPLSAACNILGINACADVAAQATGSAGSLFANIGNGAQAYATSSPSVNAFLIGANVTSGGTVSINSDSASSVYTNANSSSATLGVDLHGETTAISQITNKNSAYVLSSTVKANNFLLSALSTDDAVGANATGSNDGLLVSFGGTTFANAAVGGNTIAELEGSTTITAKNDASVLATVNEQATSNASESSGGLGTAANTLSFAGNMVYNSSSNTYSYTTVDTPVVSVPAGTTINANTSTLEADLAQALFSASANTSVTGGYGEADATAFVFVPDDPIVNVQGNLTALQKLSLIATINNNSANVRTYGYANAHTTGVTGPGSTGTDNNTTDFEPSVTVGPGVTLTTDNLYIEATTPVPPSSGSNPYWSNYANGTSDCVCPPGSSNSQGQYTFGPGTGITLNATIIEPGTASPNLTINADGSETGNFVAPESEDDIIVPNLINTATASITLNTPSGFTAGTSTVHDNTAWQTVTIINKSIYDLVLNSIEPFSDNGKPPVNVTSDPTRNNAVFNFTTDNSTPQILIENTSLTADTDIYLDGMIIDPTGGVTMSALLGSILPLTPMNQTEATTISLTANHGNIGSSSDLLNLTLVPVEGATELSAPAVPATLDILAGQNLYAGLTALEFFRIGDSVPPITNVPANLDSIEAGGTIQLNLHPGIAEIPTLETTVTQCCPTVTTTGYVNVPYTVNGIYNVTKDITAGGNILVNSPSLTTLDLQTGSTIMSGFANIGVNVDSSGNITGTPIPVNYSNYIDPNNVVMQNLQQQGGNFTIAGFGGTLTGNGTINVLNGYSNLTITNNSNRNLVLGNLSFDNPVVGTVSIFGATQSLNGTYTAGGANISLTKTSNASSTITVNENGSSGNVDLGGSINNMSGLTTISSANGSIVNTGGNSELVESNYITLNAPNGAVGSSGTPINVQVDTGSVNSTSQNDIALDQVTGNLNVGTIQSASGNVYLTAAGSIFDLSNTVYGINLVLDAIAGSIGTSGTPLRVDATGTLTGQAQTGAYITQITGPMNVNNVTSNTGNITLATLTGSVNLGSNSVDALAPNASPASVVTINANGSINDSSSNTAISGDTIVLNSSAATGNIGSSTNPIEVRNGLNAPGVVSGSTVNGNVYVNETVGALNVGTIASTGGTVNLSTISGPILNGDAILGMPANVNVTAPNINLTSNGSTIGTSSNPLFVNTTSSAGGVNANAPSDIYISDPSSTFYVKNITSTSGNVGLAVTNGDVNLNGTVNALVGNTSVSASGSIFNPSGASSVINTQGVTLNATNGSIGTLATPLRINSNAGVILPTPAVVQAFAKMGVYLNETVGALYVSTIQSATSDIYIVSDGSIFNGNSDSTAINLTGNNINLTSNNGGFGASNRRLVVNNRNGVNAVSGSASTTPTGHSLDLYANGASNGNIYVEERTGDLISSNTIESKTGNIDLLVSNGSAWLNNVNVSPFGSPATTNLGASLGKTVTILVDGNVLNANTITNPDTLTMTVNPGTTWTTTPGTDTIRVGTAAVYNTVNARADIINMPLVYALNQGSLTNDISRQTEGLHFFLSGWGNPGAYNYLMNEANNVTVNVVPCPKGCTTVPAVVFNNITTNNGTITVGEEWLELVNAIIGTSITLNTPYTTLTESYKFPQQQSATRYTPFYMFLFGTYQDTDLNSSYFNGKAKTGKGYTLTQQQNTIFNDLIHYYGLP